jgi:hypothetical protein
MKLTAIKPLMAAAISAAAFTITSSGWAATCTVPGDHATIQAAVNDPDCDVINVLPGVYIENVNIGRTVTINGAQAGVPVGTRAFASAAESKLVGQFNIAAPDVTIDGFSITYSTASFEVTAVLVSAPGTGALITNNIFDGVVNTTVGSGVAQAIHLLDGPDDVAITDNSIRNVTSDRSAKGILLGNNNAPDAPKNVVIQGNTISLINSLARGAYGISVGTSLPASGGAAGLKIVDNGISDLSGGGWVHAIGLEGETPSVVVEDNDISNLTDAGPSDDNIGVFFENNPSFGTAEVHHNNFNLTAASFGIAVHPALTGGSVNGTCNWWNSPTGPTTLPSAVPSNPGGTGTRVSPKVTFSPWLNAPAPLGTCVSPVANAEQCKKGGWMNLIRPDGTSFKNQGDCIQYTKTGK